MTIIRECEYLKALTDEDALISLSMSAMRGITAILPCDHDPVCRELNDQEKQQLQMKVNLKIRDIMVETRPLTLEDMCTHISKYLKAQSGKDVTPQQVFESNINRDMGLYLNMYEEAIFGIGIDFYGRPAPVYFEERLREVIDKPEMKPLAIRYQHAIASIEEAMKSAGAMPQGDVQ